MGGVSVAWGWLWPVLGIWLAVSLVSAVALAWLVWVERERPEPPRYRPFTADDWEELSEN